MTETLSWTDVDGAVTVLTDDGTVGAAYGLEGRFMPPTEVAYQTSQVAAGGTVTLVRHDVRELAVPIEVWAEDQTAFRAALRSLALTFNATRGDGTFTATGPDGTSRQLTCRYVGGLAPIEDWSAFNAHVTTVVVVLRAHDPYWTDVAPQTDTFAAGEQGLWLPWPPVTVLPDGVFASARVVNAGDVVAWPVWTITGPATTLKILNRTSGLKIVLAAAIGAGQTVTIDTRPGVKSVADSAGANRFASLTSTSRLWPFVAGPNIVEISFTGQSDDTAVDLSWRRRWLTA